MAFDARVGTTKEKPDPLISVRYTSNVRWMEPQLVSVAVSSGLEPKTCAAAELGHTQVPDYTDGLSLGRRPRADLIGVPKPRIWLLECFPGFRLQR